MRQWCSLQAGKLDLTEVEGLADLLAAETEAQRIQVSITNLLELLSIVPRHGDDAHTTAQWTTLLRRLACTSDIQ